MTKFRNSSTPPSLTMFDLLPVPWGLFECFDDECRCCGDHLDLSLSVLNGQLDSDAQALPVCGGLGNVFTYLLGGLHSVCVRTRVHACVHVVCVHVCASCVHAHVCICACI